MTCSQVEEVASAPPESVPRSADRRGSQRAAAAAAAAATACVAPASRGRSSTVTRGDSPDKAVRGNDRSSQLNTTTIQNRRPFDRSALNGRPVCPRRLGGGHMSPEVEIPGQGSSGSDGPFLVPSYCQSFCQNYSDLLIGGDQVLPLPSDNTGERLLCADTKAVGPFLQSCDVLPAVEVSLPEQGSRAGHLLLSRRMGSNRWTQSSGRDRSFLFHGREGPFTNSLLNCYLEQKMLDLYQQYMLENMARDQAGASDSDAAPPCPLLASELVLTSLDQLTLQLSRERRLEAGLAKDMVISCFLRMASDMQSGEISTPMLQFSQDPPAPQVEARGEEPGQGNEKPGTSAAERSCDHS
ncbi:unnamed protein product [Merluccius merluccius]